MKLDRDKIIGHIENIYYDIKMGAIKFNGCLLFGVTGIGISIIS